MATETQVNPTIFREYDIRGIVDEDLTPEVITSSAERTAPS